MEDKNKDKNETKIDVKIVSKEQALWNQMVQQTEAQIEAAEKTLIINRKILKMAKAELLSVRNR